jgi:rhomboid protease GluP
VGVNDERCYGCGRRNPGMWGFAGVFRGLSGDLGFTPFAIGACGVLYVLTLAMSGNQMGMESLLGFLSPSPGMLFLFGASGAEPVFRVGRWWTVLSASWLHGGLLHILFNMNALRQLAPPTAELFGPGRMIIIYVVSGACGFTLSTLAGSYLTLGASASICGLLGALACYGRRTGSQAIGNVAWTNAIMMAVLGFVFPGIDNFAHAGGFAGGYVTARILDPLVPERVDHLFIAVACLVASALAVVASVVHVWFLLR